MRDLIRRIAAGYKSTKLEGQEGGFVVFSGQEADTKQVVSIKILPRVLGEDPQIARRFRGLSQAIRQLNHPNIVSIRKVGEEAGLPYVVTRALEEAQPLAAKLDQPWAVDLAADVAMQVGQALEHAYNKGVPHGLLTPEKIMIQDDGRVLVTDFGLDELLTLVGSQARQAASAYLAPERAAGETSGPGADVYSMAAILYSMLTNREPQVVEGQVLPPSRFNPDVPQRLDQVIVKALSPAPSDRYPDVKTFLAALGVVKLMPSEKRRMSTSQKGVCPRCGAKDQRDRFCRKCGFRLKDAQARTPSLPPKTGSKLDEPIQITKVEVGQVEMGKGIESQETTIAAQDLSSLISLSAPMPVTSGEMAAGFPEPLDMPSFSFEDLWPTASDQLAVAMPEPLPMPAIDWAEMAPPMPEVPSPADVAVTEETDIQEETD
jgi:serine/threonine protein kinase